MANITQIPKESLYRYCDQDLFTFSSTADLESLPSIIGQSRAQDAIDFGINISGEGYNLFVMGPAGSGKYTLVKDFLDEQVKLRSDGSDWGYLHNFSDPQTPWFVSLPAGQGRQLRHDIEKVVHHLIEDLPRAFDDEYYRGRMRAIDESSRKHRVRLFGTLQAEADRKGILLLRIQDGSYAFAAKRDGEPMTSDEFEQLPLDQQEKTEDLIASLHEELQNSLLELREWERDNQEKVSALNYEVAKEVISRQINKLKHAYPKSLRLQNYFDAMQKDMCDNVDTFLKPEDSNEESLAGVDSALFRHYQINLIVDNTDLHGAPVVYENLPTHQSLLGCVENMAMMGALVTDFSLIKAGAVHRANGGYLILDVDQLLMQPFAWEGLKRALQAKEIRFDTLERMYSLVATVSLEPEPIPLDLKVILLGDRHLYYQLYELDPEFAELFKVVADFEEEITRNHDNHMLYARLLATTVQQEGLLHLDRDAVSCVIEHGARAVEDAYRLSLHQGDMTDLLRESSYWARKKGENVVSRQHVQLALKSRTERVDRIRTQLYNHIESSITCIAVTDERVGQINALSVMSVGGFSFAQPSRLTANCRYGDGDIIDIEREADLGGDIHSKGVMIMSGYLGSTYAKDKPLSMSASLVFEQSYGEVDGDSASLAELCVLLSAIAEVPLKQSLAITGSMNQHGAVQAIGGVNEKIEGFFDVCKRIDFTGKQGVIIPQSNIQHLMLNQDVIDAVAAGDFQIHAVETVDQALFLLTDIDIGVCDSQGQYPDGSFNALVSQRIQHWADIHKQEKEVHTEQAETQ
ncbi:MAG: ATP-dependent protease [Gammaproteobacteria bacterium]|nr:MAG: ATP-dependent protease [Gammaproteobacteria bacterium]